MTVLNSGSLSISLGVEVDAGGSLIHAAVALREAGAGVVHPHCPHTGA